METLQILSLSLLVFCSCISRNTENKKTANEPTKVEQSSSLEKIHQFTSKSGEPLGSLFVKTLPENDDVVSDIYIISKKTTSTDTLYAIEGNTFKNKQGIDFHVRKDEHYGYRIILKTNEYFEFIALGDSGKNVSDNIHISWNDTKKIFEVRKTP